LEGYPRLLSTPELPERPRLYLDIETDLQHSFTWLVGIADEESDKVSQFFASTPGKEREILRELAAFLSDKEGHRLVHFSGRSFDYRILSQRMEYHSIALPRPLSQSVDCLPALRRSIALPSPGFSLTEAASDFGYSFAYPEIDGWRVAYEYQQAIQLGKPIPEHLLAYNRDDVLALRFLVQEVEKIVTQ
jgi:predicted RecB family nuclease